MLCFRRIALVLAALALAGCRDTIAPVLDRGDGTPSFAISDARYDPGNVEGFYFLPPMVPNPGPFSGTFDSNQSPVVRVCELPACTTVIKTFNGGTKNEALTVDLTGESYGALWNTRNNPRGLQNGRDKYRLEVYVGTERLGYADLWFVANSRQLSSVTAGYVGVVNGGTLNIKFRIETGAGDDPPGDAFELQGSAYRDGDKFVLAQDASDQTGAVWSLQTLDLSQDFDMSFAVFLGSNPEGADGMTFTLIRDLPAGPGGGGRGLGYQGLDNSLAVELDTYQNGDFGSNDPASDHIAILLNGVVIHDPSLPLVEVPNLKDGQEHTLRIRWHAGSTTLNVYLDDLTTPRLTFTRNLVADGFGGESHVYFGFTGATGQLHNLHYFRRL